MNSLSNSTGFYKNSPEDPYKGGEKHYRGDDRGNDGGDRYKTYFVNDLVCRVRSLEGDGTEVDIGVVDYPNKLSRPRSYQGDVRQNGSSHSKFVESLRVGFSDDFYVSWRHNSERGFFRESYGGTRSLENAEDETLFLLDREFHPGMYVRKADKGTGGGTSGIGIVKAVDVFVSLSIAGEQIVNDISVNLIDRYGTLPRVGGYFMTCGWIGQVVELQKRALLSFEQDSDFLVEWMDTLAEREVDKLNGYELHHRFRTLGDRILLSALELSRVKWINSPQEKNWSWPIIRPFRYANEPATVENIQVLQIRFKWLERLPSSQKSYIDPPRDTLQAWEFLSYLQNKGIVSLNMNCRDDIAVGDCVYVVPDTLTMLDVKTYHRWANTYLQDMKSRNTESDRKNVGPPTKKIRIDNPLFVLGNTESKLTLQNSYSLRSQRFPGKIICKRSRVAVQWSPTSIESFSSIDLIPVLVPKHSGFIPGQIISVDNKPLFVMKPASTYGIVVCPERPLTQDKEEYVHVNLFQIPFHTNVPQMEESIHRIHHSKIIPHPIYNFHPGMLFCRSSLNDDFSVAVFLRACDTGELIISCPDGTDRKVSPNRVINISQRAAYNTQNKSWDIVRDRSRRYGLNRPFEFRNLSVSSKVLLYHSLNCFTDKTMKASEEDFSQHRFLKHSSSAVVRGVNPQRLEDRLIVAIQDEAFMLSILPGGIWMKYAELQKELLYSAIEGPDGTVYEDSLLFFEMKLCPDDLADKVSFVSFYSRNLIPNTLSNGSVVFQNDDVLWDADIRQYIPYVPATRKVYQPTVACVLLEIRNRNLKTAPIAKRILQCFPAIGSIVEEIRSYTTNNEDLLREIYGHALVDVARSILMQLDNIPLAWKAETMAYYQFHVPKFCCRVFRWIMETCDEKDSPSFPLLPINDEIKLQLLDALQQLIDRYNQMW